MLRRYSHSSSRRGVEGGKGGKEGAHMHASAAVAGRGIVSDTAVSSGTRLSIVSASGGATSGESSGNVRLCSCRVWCARCVARAECAVINLFVWFRMLVGTPQDLIADYDGT